MERGAYILVGDTTTKLRQVVLRSACVCAHVVVALCEGGSVMQGQSAFFQSVNGSDTSFHVGTYTPTSFWRMNSIFFLEVDVLPHVSCFSQKVQDEVFWLT